MKIIEALQVDLIEPFPLNQISRAVGWLHCYKSVVAADHSPQTAEDMAAYLTEVFQKPDVRTWGIIDKYQKLNPRHEAPLIGFVGFERISPRDGYLHTATTRKAWGSGLVDEAMRGVINGLFEDEPELLRLSALILNNNSPAKGLARRIGMSFEGVIHDYVKQQGEPKPATMFGLTRRTWAEAQVAPESVSA